MQIIVLTTCTLLALGVSNAVLFRMALHDQDSAELWNMRLEVGLFAFYWLVNLVMFVPAYLRQKTVIKALESDDEDDSDTQAVATEFMGFDDGSSDPQIGRARTASVYSVTSRDFRTKTKKSRPTVDKDAHYITFRNLKDMAVQNWGD